MNINISFPNWSGALKQAALDDKTKQRHRVIIQWYLGYLKREGVRASVASGRAFLDGLIESRRPADWQLDQWRAGMNWFFKEAPSRRRNPDGPPRVAARAAARHEVARYEAAQYEATQHEDGQSRAAPAADAVGMEISDADYEDGRRHYAFTVAEIQEKVPLDPWITEAVRLMRVRHMAYRTEETYIGWIRRMERFLQSKEGLEAFGQEDLKAFLSYLAVEEGVSASTQRQALNAGVFFLREVRKQELGDFSDYVKADPRKYYPVVYSKGEMTRLLDQMQAKWKLMAQLQYGCGLAP